MFKYCAYCGRKLELTNEISHCNECMRLGYHLSQELTGSTMEDTKRFQEQTYQQRLDKVLTRFKATPLEDNSGIEYKYTNKYGLSIRYLKPTIPCLQPFELLYNTGVAEYQYLLDISLETVESLLNDLEGEE